MDRGTWWATVPGAAKSQTRPKRLSAHTHTHTHTHTHMLHMKVAKGVNAELSSQEMRDFQCLILHECEKMDVH